MAERSVHRTMNADTFEALQAAVLATAIPDIEPSLERLRAELRGEIQDLRADMERRLNTQTPGRSWAR